jgi:uncharacterized paraquat-inducible protein A
MRNHCELCGVKLKVPELDYRKTAVCNRCIRKQGFKIPRITRKTKPFGLKIRK